MVWNHNMLECKTFILCELNNVLSYRGYKSAFQSNELISLKAMLCKLGKTEPIIPN